MRKAGRRLGEFGPFKTIQQRISLGKETSVGHPGEKQPLGLKDDQITENSFLDTFAKLFTLQFGFSEQKTKTMVTVVNSGLFSKANIVMVD